MKGIIGAVGIPTHRNTHLAKVTHALAPNASKEQRKYQLIRVRVIE